MESELGARPGAGLGQGAGVGSTGVRADGVNAGNWGSGIE